MLDAELRKHPSAAMGDIDFLPNQQDPLNP